MSNIAVKTSQVESQCVYEHISFLYQASSFMAGRCNLLSAYFGKLVKLIAMKNTIKMETNLHRQLCRVCSINLQSEVTCDLNVRFKNEDNNDKNIGGCRKMRRKRLRKLRKRRKLDKAKDSILNKLIKDPSVENLDSNAIIEIKCRNCHHQTEFPINGERTAWLDQLESITEICFIEKSKKK